MHCKRVVSIVTC